MVDQKTILLVEDEALIALAEKQLLTKEGFHVLLATTGEAAVEQACAQNAQVDLILMDINLGRGMDGTQAAELILQAREIPVVFLSSHIENAVVEKTKQITSYGYIVKNSGPVVLIASIEMAFKLHAAHARLREREGHLQAMLQAMPDMIFRLDRQGVFLDYKADVQDLYEQAVPLVGQRNRDITPPAFADLIDANIQRTLETGQIQTFEYEMPIPNIGLRKYEARMAVSGRDEVTAVVRDITGQMNTMNALKESENRYRRLVEGAPEIVYIYSTQRGALYNSPQVEKLLGYPAQYLAEHPYLWVEAVHPEDAAQVSKTPRGFDRDAPSEIRYRIRNAQGEWVWVQDRVFRRQVEGDDVVLEGMISDISELKRAEYECAALRKQLEERHNT